MSHNRSTQQPVSPNSRAAFHDFRSTAQRDIIVIGASVGGVETLKRLFAPLRPDLSAAFFVVMHMSPLAPSALPQLLSRSGRLRAQHAIDNAPIEPGHIYVAPPDFH